MSWLVAAAASAAAVVAWMRLAQVCELTARASHELRGPLTAAGLAVDAMAARDELPPDRAFALDAQLRRARLALDDLVAAPARAHADDRLEPVRADVLVAHLALAWRPVAAARGVELRVAPSAVDGDVLADRTRVMQAAGNLIANALEHGSGPIELRARAAGGRLRLEVRDGGPGLPAPLGTLRRRPRGARGRGLAIASAIAERHGGRVAAAPSAAGATVVLELPLRTAGAAAAGEARA